MNQNTPWTRWTVGGLTTLLAVAGLLWTGMIFTAEYRFRRFSQDLGEKTQIDETALRAYKDNLRNLTRLDPTNGEILNRYASVLGRLADYQEAVDVLNVARRTLNTRNSLYFLSDMYTKMGDVTNAEAVMADCLLINPSDREFNPARLHLLCTRFFELLQLQRTGKLKDTAAYEKYHKAYGEATLNWAIRAPHDKNSHLFLGNYYIEPLYPLAAYRNFLVGLSGASWLNLNDKAMIATEVALQPIGQILQGRYAKPYKNLP